MTRATAERAFLLCLMAACVVLLAELRHYPVGSLVFPAILLVLLSGFSGLALARVARTRAADAAFFDHAPRFVLMLGLLVAYTAALPWVGYYTTSAAMIVAVPPLLGYRAWRVIVPVGAGFLVAVWLIFNVLFQREMAREFFLPWILGY